MSSDFDCEAYGPGSRGFGAWCFLAGQGERECASQAECHQVVTGERKRVFQRIHELAAQGDEVGVFLAGEFTSPEQILGGGEDDE